MKTISQVIHIVNVIKKVLPDLIKSGTYSKIIIEIKHSKTKVWIIRKIEDVWNSDNGG